MSLIACILAVAALAPPAPARKSELRLTELVAAVRSADYRGDRAALARLDGELGAVDAGPLTEYRDYWRGFALWRRAMNGFNETPTPDDLGADLERAVARFRASLQKRPDWIEARLAMVGCWGNLMYIARDDPERMKALLVEVIPEYKWLQANGRENSRALWILGGMEFFAPPPRGGDLVKAAATLRHGIACAWRESLAGAAAPAWVPSWGGPENLMNLAYIYAHAATPDRAAALAYAEGALTAVPEWHYVRDILLPQIEALPEAVAAR